MGFAAYQLKEGSRQTQVIGRRVEAAGGESPRFLTVQISMGMAYDASVRKDGSESKPRTNEGVFATTHWSVVVSAGQSGSEAAFVALDKLCQAYWYPLFAYVRQRGHTEDQAKDLTQAFFAQLIGRNYLAAADPERGRFRTFLLTSLNHFLANEWNRGQAQKRGGGVEFISLDYVHEQEGRSLDPGHNLTPERIYEQRWAEAVLAKVLERLRGEFDGATIKRFDVLKQFLTEEKGATSYAGAAQALGMTNQAVKSAVHRLRQRWRELIREEIAHTVHAATSQDVDDEIRHLLNVLA